MRVRAHNPETPPNEQNCRYPLARGLFCGIFKKAKRCKKQCKQKNPADDVEVVRYSIVEDDARRRPAQNPCATCGFGVPPNPPGHASSRERWKWAMSQVGRPIANPGGCPTCGNGRSSAALRNPVGGAPETGVPPAPLPSQDRCGPGYVTDTRWIPGYGMVYGCYPVPPSATPNPPVENCPGGVICGWNANGTPICAQSVSDCGTLTGGGSAASGMSAGRIGYSGHATAPMTAAQMLSQRRMRRATASAIRQNGQLAAPERVRNCCDGPLALALAASDPFRQQNPNGFSAFPLRGIDPTFPGNATEAPLWSRMANPGGHGGGVHGGGGGGGRTWSTWWSPPGGYGPMWWRTPSTPAVQIPFGVLPPSVPTPWIPAPNPGWLAVAGAALLGAAAGAGASCLPRAIRYAETADQFSSTRAIIRFHPCGGAKRFEGLVTRTFKDGSSPLTFGPERFELFEEAAGWANEQAAHPLFQIAPPSTGPVTTSFVPNPRAVPRATLMFPPMRIDARAPKMRNRNPLLHNPGVWPPASAHSQFAPLPPQWFYHAGVSTAGAPYAAQIPFAAPGPPPGVFGRGAFCYNDRDCSKNEYCHSGVCVPEPWSRGVGVTSNPTHNAQMQALTVPLAPGVALR